MDLYPVRYELDFEELKATEGYNPPDDFLIHELPLDAGGALPGREETRDLLWYEYPNPFDRDWDRKLKEEADRLERQLRLEEESLTQRLDEMERQRQQLELDLHRRLLSEKQRQHEECLTTHYQLQDWDLQREETLLQLDEDVMRMTLELDEKIPQLSVEARKMLCQRRLDVMRRQRLLGLDMQRDRLEEIERQRLDVMNWQHLNERQRQRLDKEWHQLSQELDVLYSDEWQLRLQGGQDDYSDDEGPDDELWASSSNREGSDGEIHTCSSSSSGSDDAPEEHKFHVKELQVHMHEISTYSSSPVRDEPEELQVHLQMHENDAANIPRYRLFKSEAKTEDLRLKFPLKIPYYIYAGRCNLNVEGYELRYADFFPNFYRWSHKWVCPTTYEGDAQYVDFFKELLGKVEYMETKDRVLAKAITIAKKGFRKILYFQIELAVGDCMMLHEEKEKFDQRWNLYCYIVSEIYFQKQKYECVLERVMNGHEVLPYELTELGNDPNEDDELEMREFVEHLVRSIPIELPFTTEPDDVYKDWVSEQMKLQCKPYFHIYLNYLVDKLNMAQDLGLLPEDTS